jgi:hypothetical protein
MYECAQHVQKYTNIYIHIQLYIYMPTYITLHFIMLHHIALHYIIVHDIKLHYTRLHYITLHYIPYINIFQQAKLARCAILQTWGFQITHVGGPKGIFHVFGLDAIIFVGLYAHPPQFFWLWKRIHEILSLRLIYLGKYLLCTCICIYACLNANKQKL